VATAKRGQHYEHEAGDRQHKRVEANRHCGMTTKTRGPPFQTPATLATTTEQL
jgi:hypothetical protein